MAKIVAAIGFKNEANFYLERVIKDLLSYVDEVVCVDDYSTDNSAKVAQSAGALVYPNTGVSCKECEGEYYDFVTQKALDRNPDWILRPDADEIFEEKFKREIRKVTTSDKLFAQFDSYEMWTETQYVRYWEALSCRKFYRVHSELRFSVGRMPAHGPTIPYQILELPPEKGWPERYRFKHYGFANEELRQRRIDRNLDYSKKIYKMEESPYLRFIRQREISRPPLVDWCERG